MWTLKNRGGTFSIPGTLHRDWQIDALEGEAGAGNTPPRLSFTEAGPQGIGDPGERDKEAIERDLADGLVTPAKTT